MVKGTKNRKKKIPDPFFKTTHPSGDECYINERYQNTNNESDNQCHNYDTPTINMIDFAFF